MPVTLKEIAAEAGVSIYTVSRVLNGKTKEAYAPAIERAKHIRQVAERLGFIPNSAARAMQSNQTKVIGVLIREENPMGSLVDYETVLGVNTGLEAAGYVLALTRSTDIPITIGETRRPISAGPHRNPPSRLFRERMVDGMIVLGPVPQTMCDLVERISPICLWMDSNINRQHNCLRRDEYHAGRTVALQMIQRGYRKLIYLDPTLPNEPRHYSFTDRARGVHDAAAEHGCALQEVHINPPHYEQISQSLPPLLSRDAAVIVPNDRHAMAVQAQLPRLGKLPGVDFAMAACDCVHSVRIAWPDLSCVDVQRYELGISAAEMMVRMLQSPDHKCPAKTVQWGWHEGATIPPCC